MQRGQVSSGIPFIEKIHCWYVATLLQAWSPPSEFLLVVFTVSISNNVMGMDLLPVVWVPCRYNVCHNDLILLTSVANVVHIPGKIDPLLKSIETDISWEVQTWNHIAQSLQIVCKDDGRQNIFVSSTPPWHKTAYRNSIYSQTSNISRTKSQHLNISRLVLQLSLSNPFKPGVK